MTGPVGEGSPALGRDCPPDPVDVLATAWAAWEAAPSAPWTANAKEDALRALGLSGIATHHHIVNWRRHGYSIPDAVQALINDTQETAA